MIWRLMLLVIGALAFWGASYALASIVWQDEREVTLGYSGTALALCLFPAVATMFWTHQIRKRAPEQELVAALGGTGVRLFFVLSVGMFLTVKVDFYNQRSFLTWLLLFYLYVLALEMLLLVKGRATEAATTNTVGTSEPRIP
jgi:hypothetical protein